jgi:hypothetical protein
MKISDQGRLAIIQTEALRNQNNNNKKPEDPQDYFERRLELIKKNKI